jgi:hypothetical protein
MLGVPEELEALLGAKWVTLAAPAAALTLLVALVILHLRYTKLRRVLEAGGIFGQEPPSEPEPPGGDSAARPFLDRLLPRTAAAFLGLVIVLGAGMWGMGYVLAPDKARFLEAPEWRFQPVYLAAHLMTLRFFISVLARNFAAGAAHLDMPPQKIARGLRLVLGPLCLLVAAAIAAPFCVLDYLYLLGDAYNRMGASGEVLPVDMLMWGIWCAEWLLNAVIWVLIAGFVAMSIGAIRTYPFRAPIEVVLNERHYRPFLQMSSQGASIVLGFAIVTAIYILFTDAAMTDYLGLGITILVLVCGFLPSWLLLNAKVADAVGEETAALRRSLAGGREPAETAAGKGLPAGPTLDRLDQAVTMLRIQHLERLHERMGRAEVRALTLRLVAPAAPAVWQLANNFQDVLARAWVLIRTMAAPLLRLFA